MKLKYLAILQNGAYQIAIPAHVGGRITYRGTHPQAMPLFNGSILFSLNASSFTALVIAMAIHPTQQSQQGHQNPIHSYVAIQLLTVEFSKRKITTSGIRAGITTISISPVVNEANAIILQKLKGLLETKQKELEGHSRSMLMISHALDFFFVSVTLAY